MNKYLLKRFLDIDQIDFLSKTIHETVKVIANLHLQNERD